MAACLIHEFDADWIEGMDAQIPLKRTPLYDLHVALGARIVPFAGYEMPVQYPAGILKEHLHTRAAAGLFDISHMGQIVLEGGADIREQCEKIVPCDLRDLAAGGIRYSFLLNEQGGVLDDLMITRPHSQDERNMLFVIVNAACKDKDCERFRALLPNMKVTMLEDRALIALQGPKAAEVLGRFCEAPRTLKFMQADKFEIKDVGQCLISRSGYTGEDGFEISVPNATVRAFADSLLAGAEVMPIGLGARDSLRLEAGLSLYGHELDTTTTPVEADLMWSIAKRRRVEGGFIGAAKIQGQLAEGVTRKLVGILPEGRALAREQTEILSPDGARIGVITSGGFGPSIDGPVALGYVETAYAKIGTPVSLLVRGKALPAKIAALPFVQHRYFRGSLP
jgi:aminomethyltransferase